MNGIPLDRLDALAKKVGVGPYLRTQPVAEGNNKFFVREDGDDFVFSNLPGIQEDVTLLGSLADGGAQKTQPQWFDYSKTNSDSVMVPNSRVLYQMMRQLYYSRDDTQLQDVVESCVNFFRINYDSVPWKHTGSKVAYKTGFSGSVMHLKSDKTVQSIDCDIPEFTKYDDNWSFFVLAKEQSEEQLGSTERILKSAEPVLEALLGDGYSEVGAVCQYIGSRKDGNLREVRLWTPTEKTRNAERAVVLGVINNVRFNIIANDIIINNWPALGVVYAGAKKVP